VRKIRDEENERIKKLEKHASYERNKPYYKKYYRDNKKVINDRSKDRWANLSEAERAVCYAAQQRRYKENPRDFIARVKKRYENLSPEEKEKILENQRIRRSGNVKKKRRIISKGIQY